MKHLLNNLSEQEKSSILSQHKGGIEIATKNFKNLLEHKSGSVRPLLMEQETNGQTQKNKIIEVTNGSVIPQSLVDGAPPPCTYTGSETITEKGVSIDLTLQDGTVYRMWNPDFNYAGDRMPGKLFAELNTIFLTPQKDKEGNMANAFFGENEILGEKIVKNSNDKWIGFRSDDRNLQFACFTNVNGKFGCSTFKWRSSALRK